MQNFVNAPHRGETRGAATGAPNAALLIDFDNVTMGIRSDLTRQMKDLLSSDIIRGKVAVQRAYADWRRYAQYIVPLSEASVDLIFAPAYGSSKKNATDIRLAIDALELVFTRPEIGTFILLSGDSDFSSLVLKLKEYGKYVIGVGLRESASDLLVQNCDEYFSYSSLTGLTKAGEEETVGAMDPWELVERSVNQMADDNDVMRSDRLKQVMLDLDPNFDEAEIGYSKFNKFLTEAASRNRLALRKLGNGQYEVQPLTEGGAAAREEPKSRGRREEARGRGRKRPEPPKEMAAESPREQVREQTRERARAAEKPKPEPKTRERRAEDVEHGYDLLKQAIRDLIEESGGAARDSDIKRKMLELETGWDESELGFTKFSRFLRQAHDAEVIDLQRTSEGYYEARLPSGAGGSVSKRESGGRGRGERGRSETRPSAQPRTDEATARRPERREEEPKAEVKREEPKPEPRREQAKAETRPESKPEPEPESRSEQPKSESKPESRPEQPKSESRPESRPEQPKSEAKPEQPKAEQPKAAPKAEATPRYGRRDRRGKVSDGPPPLLPGQAVGGTTGGGNAEASAAETTRVEPSKPMEKPAQKEKPAQETAAKETAAMGDAEPAVSGPGARVETAPAAGGPAEAEKAPREAPGAPAFDPEEIGLPTEAGAVIRYLSNSYQGVGQKTAEALIEAFGADRVFNGLNSQPETVREVLGSGRRTDILLEAWERDHRRRTTAGAADKQPAS